MTLMTRLTLNLRKLCGTMCQRLEGNLLSAVAVDGRCKVLLGMVLKSQVSYHTEVLFM